MKDINPRTTEQPHTRKGTRKRLRRWMGLDCGNANGKTNEKDCCQMWVRTKEKQMSKGDGKKG